MKVRIGIIGLGYWGPNLVRNFLKFDSVSILYCCDSDQKRRSVFQKKFPSIPFTTNAHDIFDDPAVDAAVIATPSDTHASLVEQALRAGKHVFVEKPFTLSTQDAQKLISLANKTKRILMVGHTYEYHPIICAMKEYLSRKVVGRIFYLYSSRLNLGQIRHETNVLWSLAPHDISIFNYLLESVPSEVSAFGHGYLSNREDVAFINLRYPRTINAHIHVSWLDPSKERKLTIVGSKKMMIFDDFHNETPLRIYDKGVVKLVNEKGERMFGEYQFKLRPGDIQIPYIAPKEPLEEECAHFLSCIKTKTQPNSNGESGLRVVQVLEAAQRSLHKGGTWIKVT